MRISCRTYSASSGAVSRFSTRAGSASTYEARILVGRFGPGPEDAPRAWQLVLEGESSAICGTAGRRSDGLRLEVCAELGAKLIEGLADGGGDAVGGFTGESAFVS